MEPGDHASNSYLFDSKLPTNGLKSAIALVETRQELLSSASAFLEVAMSGIYKSACLPPASISPHPITEFKLLFLVTAAGRTQLHSQ